MPAVPRSPAQPGKPPPQSSGRMTLTAVKRGPIQKPRRVLVHGVEKVGKSSFAAGAEKPVFVCPEDGTSMLDVSRFPEPQTWLDVLDAIDVLRTQEHEYQTVVFDTLDWLEPLLWAHVCAQHGQESIEGFGYGKGYAAALDEWRVFVARLEQLRAARGMHVLLLAHSWIKGFKNPLGEDYDRFEMKLHPKAGGFLREWCDAVLFAAFEEYAHKDEKKRVRGISTGTRLLYTERSAAYDAGNRYNLPPQLPLDYAAFADAVNRGQVADPATITARITEMLATVADADLRTKVEAAVAKAPTDATYLARVANTLAARLSTQENAR